ncbi:hypothetical protein BJ508DRAFT_379941 [Ascobolus immersus RN42]|uniref:Uncharacterized protein n=1 Tax=Ascobolus immersus RN42 TaxID=1160509 RepID=A0A3N4HSX9_ASCIM|nr:hypothetical protein BJ508DRAFT_379941 [Ascobolus immersus RN42]
MEADRDYLDDESEIPEDSTVKELPPSLAIFRHPYLKAVRFEPHHANLNCTNPWNRRIDCGEGVNPGPKMNFSKNGLLEAGKVGAIRLYLHRWYEVNHAEMGKRGLSLSGVVKVAKRRSETSRGKGRTEQVPTKDINKETTIRFPKEFKCGMLKPAFDEDKFGNLKCIVITHGR